MKIEVNQVEKCKIISKLIIYSLILINEKFLKKGFVEFLKRRKKDYSEAIGA